MNFHKCYFQLILILLLCLFTIKESSIKIPYAKEDLPITKEDEDFHPFDIALYFKNSENNKSIIHVQIKFRNKL